MQLRKATEIATRRFLASPEGMELMLQLREAAPRIARGDGIAVAFDSGKSEGWRDCLDAIAEITPREKPKEANLDNPSLVS